MKIKQVKKACTMFEAEITLCDGSVHRLIRRSLSDLQNDIREGYDYSCIDDYVIKESAYYEIIPEVN